MYDIIVRDRYPEMIASKYAVDQFQIRRIDEVNYLSSLCEGISNNMKSIASCRDINHAKLIDAYEMLVSVCNEQGTSIEDIREKAAYEKILNGGYGLGLVMDFGYKFTGEF